MKKLFLLLVAAISVVGFTSCDSEPEKSSEECVIIIWEDYYCY